MRQRIGPWCGANDKWCTVKDERAERFVARNETTIDVSLENANWQGSSGGVDIPILTD
jgi:hypothetical protein